MYALDSNVIIHAFQGKGRVAERLSRVSPHEIAIPTVVLYEVEQGVLRSHNSAKRRKQLVELASVAMLLPFDDESARVAARLQVDLQRQGLRIGDLDTLIAATAVAAGVTLVTHNTREFSRVKGLRLEDWFD
ncbi:MAG: PIN domain-containing protein [Bryobacteraceae bacterium]